MLVCANCGKKLAECCDLFEHATDEDGKDCVLCYHCIAELGLDVEEGEHIA